MSEEDQQALMTRHPRAPQTRTRVSSTPEPTDIRERIERDRQATIEAFRRLGMSPAEDNGAAHGASADEGDEAQASERQEMGLAYRERLADRINRLTRALELLERGTYGVCEVCKNPIGAGRLAAIPEVTTCRECQERVEREAA
jgi:RNA polymerase-binding transcription factor DksA